VNKLVTILVNKLVTKLVTQFVTKLTQTNPSKASIGEQTNQAELSVIPGYQRAFTLLVIK